MYIERTGLALRPRTGWEAIDLGFLLARTVWPALALAYALWMLPLAGLLIGLLWLPPAGGVLLLWWLKPVGDRLALFVLSQAALGEKPSLGPALRAWPRLIGEYALGDLTWRRFSPARSFLLPIHQLEGLRGKALRQRVAVLNHHEGDLSWVLTLSSNLLEGALWFSAFLLMSLMLPREMDANAFQLAVDTYRPGAAAQLGAYLIAVCLIEPFYVAGGFGLYLNRRIFLEGWDLERSFKRLVTRLTGTSKTVLAVAACALALSLAAPGWAQSDPSSSSGSVRRETLWQVRDEVLSSKDFGGLETRQRFRLKGDLGGEGKEEAAPASAAPLLALGAWLARSLPWIAGPGLFLSAGYLLWKSRRLADRLQVDVRSSYSPESRTRTQVPIPNPSESLALARSAWSQQQHREAVALLYRGALGHLTLNRKVHIPPAATEGEALSQLARVLTQDTALHSDFAELTRVWQAAAYAGRVPSPEVFAALCAAWDGRLMESPA